MHTVRAYEAKNHLPKILNEINDGKTIILPAMIAEPAKNRITLETSKRLLPKLQETGNTLLRINN